MQRKVPIRTCIACRTERPKRELIRIVRTPAGEIGFDFSGKLAGRGAYICESEACVAKLARGKLLNKAFSVPVSAETYEKLARDFAAREAFLGKKQD